MLQSVTSLTGNMFWSLYSKIELYLMADEATVKQLLELYHKCKQNGEKASFFMETMNGVDTTITFTIKCSAGTPADSTRRSPRGRWKTPSQLKRDKERKEKFLAKKLDDPIDNGKKESKKGENVVLVDPTDEIDLDVCEKIFVIPKKKIDNYNIAIEADVIDKLKAKGINVKRVRIERFGDPIRGEYARSEAIIEPTQIRKIEQEDFGIKNCWVLPEK